MMQHKLPIPIIQKKFQISQEMNKFKQVTQIGLTSMETQ